MDLARAYDVVIAGARPRRRRHGDAAGPRRRAGAGGRARRARHRHALDPRADARRR